MKTKELSQILTGVAATGVILTTILSVKATKKAKEVVEKEHAETPKEIVKSCWKLYIPTGISMTATIVSIFGIDYVNESNRKALIAICASLANNYDKYTNKVKELYGEKVHNYILDEIERDECNPPYLSSVDMCSINSLDFKDDDEPVHLFYDPISEKYFDSTYSAVLQAEYHLNRNFVLKSVECMSTFYEFLGIEGDPKYDEIGWCNSDGIGWIDFDHRKITLDNGEECYVIDMIWGPTPLDKED